MVENIGARRDNRFERRPFAAKIGNEHFDPATRDAPANFFNGAGKNSGSTVGLVVAIHGSDDGIAQAHLLDGFGNAQRLVFLGRANRLARRDGAETAGARADVSQNHERGSAMIPALAHVGAAGALTDGVQVERAHDALQVLIVRPAKEFHAQPGRARMHFHRRRRRNQ